MLQRQRGLSENDLRRKALLENELREVNAEIAVMQNAGAERLNFWSAFLMMMAYAPYSAGHSHSLEAMPFDRETHRLEALESWKSRKVFIEIELKQILERQTRVNFVTVFSDRALGELDLGDPTATLLRHQARKTPEPCDEVSLPSS